MNTRELFRSHDSCLELLADLFFLLIVSTIMVATTKLKTVSKLLNPIDITLAEGFASIDVRRRGYIYQAISIRVSLIHITVFTLPMAVE